jgi:DNA polymerase sigma
MPEESKLNYDTDVYFVGVFHSTVSDFTSKMPVITTLTTLNAKTATVNIVVNNGCAVETSRLLSVYSLLDSRVQPLAVALRYWAKVKMI